MEQREGEVEGVVGTCRRLFYSDCRAAGEACTGPCYATEFPIDPDAPECLRFLSGGTNKFPL